MQIVGLLVGLVGCANNVAQDRSTGPAGRSKGVKAVVLEENRGEASGVVTYSGDDRGDWKSIELPAGKSGTLELEVAYTTQHPRQRVAFDVFDQWNTPIVRASAGDAVPRRLGGRILTATIDKAKGTYFVRIYAPRRGDIGAYRLLAEFKPDSDLQAHYRAPAAAR